MMSDKQYIGLLRGASLHTHRWRDPGTIIECGACEAYHRDEFAGDCRDDDERFPTWEVKVCACGAYRVDEGDPYIHELRRVRT